MLGLLSDRLTAEQCTFSSISTISRCLIWSSSFFPLYSHSLETLTHIVLEHKPGRRSEIKLMPIWNWKLELVRFKICLPTKLKEITTGYSLLYKMRTTNLYCDWWILRAYRRCYNYFEELSYCWKSSWNWMS